FLNVKGEANVLLKIKDAWAFLFSTRAILSLHEQKFDHFKAGVAVSVQKMIQAEKSGIMFTIDPVTNDKTKIIIKAIYGLDELIVQGSVIPDHYEVSKNDFKITTKKIAAQKIQLVKKGIENKEVKIPQKKQTVQKISDKEIIDLAHIGKMLEKHSYFPQ
ncbi:MAG: phosphoenolpyruvate synthase, partial [Bacteroidetes bacterium]